MRKLALLIALVTLASAAPGAAFTCALTPRGDAVIVKTDNPHPKPTTCSVTCRFTVPGGVETVDCTQDIPGNAMGWTVCLRPTGGKAFTFEGGIESCRKPPPG